MKQRSLILVVTLILATALLTSGATQARPATPGQALQPSGGAPPLFSYQGLLLDSAGNPVPNGVYTMTFSLYDSPMSGTPFWSETQPVPVEGGLFNATLGIFTPIDPVMVDGRPLWLGVTLAGEPEMVPRQNLVSVPYALNASDTRGANLHPLSVSAVTIAGTALYGSAPVTGVLGLASASTGWTYGVYGRADSSDGRGVLGYVGASSGSTFGVYGYAVSTAGTGVYGNAVSASGSTYGVSGRSGSTAGTGVYGWASATSGQTYGLYGLSASTAGTGVYGEASAVGGSNYGVYGRSASTAGQGMHGVATATTGQTIGVFGAVQSPNGVGVYGSGGASGVYGVAELFGVYGATYETSGWSGYFVTTFGNGVYISTPASQTGLNVAGGSKNAVVATADGARLLYSEESSQVWFSDYGFGELKDGTAVVTIDPLFAQTVNLEKPYHVFLTANSADIVILSVAVKGRTSFTVIGKTLDGRPADCAFDYRLVAVRLGYEKDRLERAPWADDDPNLYPERRAAWEARHPQVQPPASFPGGEP